MHIECTLESSCHREFDVHQAQSFRDVYVLLWDHVKSHNFGPDSEFDDPNEAFRKLLNDIGERLV